MSQALSSDLRRRVIALYRRGGVTYAEVAAHFGVGQASVSRWLRLFRETGSAAPRAHGGGRRRLIGDEVSPLLERLVLEHPDLSEIEYAQALQDRHQLVFHPSTVGRAIRRLGFGVKKRPSLPLNNLAPTLLSDDDDTENSSITPPLRVWFMWTKPASKPQ